MRTLLILLLSIGLIRAADLTLPAIDGTQHTPLIAKDGRPTLLIFVSPFCSTTKAFVAEINKIATENDAKINTYIVQSDPEVTRDVAIEHATLSEFKTPVLLDTQQLLMQQLKATVTPEAILLNAKAEPYYQGRINDLYLGPTKRQRAATIHDLRAAITALLAAQPAPQPQLPAQGCKIGSKK